MSDSWKLAKNWARSQPGVRLHKRVIDALQGHHRTQAQWRALIQLALHLEEVAKNENNPQPHFMRTYRVERSLFHQTFCSPVIEYYWEVVLKRPLLQIAGGFLFLMTLVIVWSECTFFLVRPSLSIAAAIVHTASDGYHYKYIQLCAMVVISYMCVCAYYTVFKLRIYRYYHLDPHHQTDANSLLFSAILLCRLTPPLCLNFLGMIHLDSHVSSEAGRGVETQFTKLMGHLDVLPLVAKGINIYLPMLILLLCLGTWFRVGTRLLHSLGIDQFVGDDDMTTEMVQGGKALVSFERNRLNREVNREQRDQYWAEKLQDTSRTRRGYGGNSSDGGASDSRLSSGRDYNDRTPIVADQDDDYSTDPFRSTARSYGSPGQPPKNLFDDL
uniref:Uncharacterized protein n=1 Tax=Plectus sambesii TaxID=2011161 RepID=A0A914XNZ7_9BILA